MKFHVEVLARDNFDPMGAVPVQKMVFEHLNKLVNPHPGPHLELIQRPIFHLSYPPYANNRA